MSDARLIKAGIVFVGLAVLLAFVGVALAQVPTPQNPLPSDDVALFDLYRYLVEQFRAAWYLGAAAVLFGLVAVVRGKVVVAGKQLRIWKITEWFEGKGSSAKFWIVMTSTAVGSALASLATIDGEWSAGTVTSTMFGGLIAGVALALAAMGVNSGKNAVRKAAAEDDG